MSGNTPVVTLLKTANQNSNISLSGPSKDKTSILVTEVDNTSDYTNPTANSYWLNVANPLDTTPSVGAYAVSYNNMTNSYVFSCVLNSSSRQCQSNKFGIAQASSPSGGIPQSQVETMPLNNFVNLNGVNSIRFFSEL